MMTVKFLLEEQTLPPDYHFFVDENEIIILPMKIVILPVGVVQLSPQQKSIILVVKNVENVVIHKMGTSSIVPNLDNASIQRRKYVQYLLLLLLLLLPTPVMLNLHAKMVDATILPLLVVDVVE